MKKTLLLVLSVVTLQLNVLAQKLTETSAENIAANWLKECCGDNFVPQSVAYLKSDSSLCLVQMENGWVILNVTGSAYPVVAYSATGQYDLAAHHFSLEAEACKTRNENISVFVNAYSRIPRKFVPSKYRAASVAPLLTTKWSQDEPFNGMLPIDPSTMELSAAGCGPTAAAQVLNFHKFPSRGYGSNIYTPASNKYMGELSVNFADQTYSYATEEDIQKLFYHIGVAVSADYSSASTSSTMTSLCRALIKNFSYDPATCRLLKRSDYSNTEWIGLIKADLDKSQPIIYSGSNPTGGGHGFVIDGYENDRFFSVKWGWGGRNDGIYSIYALQGSEFNYTLDNYMITGIKPCASPVFKPDLTLLTKLSGSGPIILGSSNAFVSSEDTISDTDTAYIKFSLANFGAADMDATAEIQLLVNGIDIYKGAYKTVKMVVGSSYPYSFVLPVALKAGLNTITVNLDPKNTIAELDESNNSFIETIFVKKSFSEADLHFVATSYMADSLILSNTASPNDFQDDLASNLPLYSSFAIQNTGNVDMKSAVEINAYLDGVLFADTATAGKLVNGTISKFENLTLPALASGSHQLKIVIDPNDKIPEIDETNNVIIREFTAAIHSVIDKANLAFVPFSLEYDTVAVSQSANAQRLSDTLPVGLTVMFNAYLSNVGVLDALSFALKRVLRRNNAYYSESFFKYPAVLKPNSFASFKNISLGNLPVGDYELVLTADESNVVDEFNENDNRHIVRFAVVDVLPQASQPTGITVVSNGATLNYETAGVAGATSYTWTLVPAAAGTVTGSGATASVTWSDTYTGSAVLSVQPFNGTVSGNASAGLNISIASQFSPVISLQAATASLASTANSTATVKVESNTSWTAVSDQPWLTVSPLGAITGNGSLVFTAQANVAMTPRSATITISADGVSAQTISVSQQGSLVSGLNEPLYDISLYPNPASSELFIGTDSPSAVQFFDANGQLVFSAETVGNQPLDIDKLPSGMFTVKILSNNCTVVYLMQKL